MILKSDASGRVLVSVERQVELEREFERSGIRGDGGTTVSDVCNLAALDLLAVFLQSGPGEPDDDGDVLCGFAGRFEGEGC